MSVPGTIKACAAAIALCLCAAPMNQSTSAMDTDFEYTGEWTEEDQRALEEILANAQVLDDITAEPLFVGDSRTYGMGVLAGRFSYIAKSSTGYNWLSAEGQQYLIDQIQQSPMMDIVFCLGVNDLGNVYAYVDFYNSFAAQYPEYNFYIMSVNPIDDAAASANHYYARNGDVAAFNDIMQSTFPERYLDTYTYLMQNGFYTADGVHYTAQTYADIENAAYDMIIEKKKAAAME